MHLFRMLDILKQVSCLISKAKIKHELFKFFFVNLISYEIDYNIDPLKVNKHNFRKEKKHSNS